MRKIFVFVIALISISWSQAYADYSFGYNSNDGTYGVEGTLITPTNGNGPITVSGGSVTGTGSANQGILYSLITEPPTGHLFGGTDLIFDNALSPGSSTFLTSDGLLFKSNDGTSYLSIWGNSPTSYTLFYLSASSYGPQLNGTATLAAVPTPIPGSAWLLGSAVAGVLGFASRKNESGKS